MSPNPVVDVLNINFLENKNIEKVVVYDAIGNQVLDLAISVNASSTSVDFSNLTSGIYFVKAITQDGNETATQKVVKR